MLEEYFSDARQWLRARRGEIEELLSSLVLTNSFTANAAGGNQVGALLRQALQVAPLLCTAHPSTRFADSLVFATRAPGRPAVLVGHLDTVFPPGSFESFRIHDGRAFGPGVLDMKGGLVVATYALLALHHIGVLAAMPVCFIVVGDEETGSPESQTLIREAARDARFGLVFEGGRPGDAVVTRRKGTGSVTATAFGRAAHAGNAHRDGVNAIWALAQFIDAAQRRTNETLGHSVNVGTISGGSSKNTVPDRARCEIDIRFTSKEDGTTLLEALNSDAERVSASMPRVRIELEAHVSREPLERTDASARLVEQYFACARAAGLGANEAGLVGGGSDANTLGAAGIPCIDGLGPRGSGYHTLDEQVDLDSLVPKAEAVTRLLLQTLETQADQLAAAHPSTH